MRFAVFALLVGYGGLLAWLTMSPHPSGPESTEVRLHLYPLKTTREFLAVGGWPMLVNVVGNLVAFIPLGILWPLARRQTKVWHVGLLAAAVSLLIETLQYTSGMRVADVDDVLLNTIGGLLGFGLYLLVVRATASAIAASSPRRRAD